MKSVKDLPQSDRPREKLLKRGAAHLSDEELLAVILGKGTKKTNVLTLARLIIKEIDEKGLDLSAHDLLNIDGIGQAKAALVEAAFELVRRRIKPEGVKIEDPKDVLPLVRHYCGRKQEHFICVSLNGANEVLNVRVVTIGLIDRSHVHPREVFADVIAERASSVIVAHNHPEGPLTPSPEDHAVTQRLNEAANILGIRLLDHIIFNQKDYYSFNDEDSLQSSVFSHQ